MRIILAIMLTTLLVSQAARAEGLLDRKREPTPPISEEEKKRLRDAEKAYKDSLSRIPENKKYDPWAKQR